MTPRLRTGLALLLLLALLPNGTSNAQEAGTEKAVEDALPERPNVVVIMADDLGYGDISAFEGDNASASEGGAAGGGSREGGGEGWIETPHLERMAAEGMRLTDFHAGAPVCSPTRASLMTGRYPHRAGLADVVYAARDANRHHGLHQKEFTLAELAGQAGYRTGVFGKWHLGYRTRYNPTRNGFGAFRGFVSGNVDYVSHVDNTGVHDWWQGDEKIREEGYATRLITEHALRFIEENRGGPFLLYVAHQAPHWPYQAPGDAAIRKAGTPEKLRTPPRQTPGTAYVRGRYRQMVRQMDKGVGRILDALRQRELAERTLVLFFSDNGPKSYGSAGGLRGWKGSVFEGGHRVPAFAWWPGRVEAASQSSETMSTLDVLPTVADLIGQDPPEGLAIDGTSLARALLEGGALERRQLFWGWHGQQAVREGPWKLTRRPLSANTDEEHLEGVQLYNLAEDPGEERDLSAKHPGRTRRLQQALDAWEKEVATGATEQPAR